MKAAALAQCIAITYRFGYLTGVRTQVEEPVRCYGHAAARGDLEEKRDVRGQPATAQAPRTMGVRL